MASREYRQVQVTEFRVGDGGAGTIVADVLRYGVVDDYRTTFVHGVFTDSLATRLPRICWAHDWHEPLGQWTDADDTRDRLRLKGELDLEMIPGTAVPAVPMAHRAYLQLSKRTIDQFSVGFMRQEDRPVEGMPGITAITRGQLDEASPVLVGAVPGTALISVRSARHAGLLHSRRARPLFPQFRAR